MKNKYNIRGKFIIIDGGEGSGKTTMIRALKDLFPNEDILVTHEPGGTPFADKIRELALSKEAADAGSETQFGLMWAARAEHLHRKIIPVLSAGTNVVCDRFDSSTFAYQIYGQENEQLKNLFWDTRKVYLGNFVPDIYIFMDVEPKTGLLRVKRRKEEKTHFDNRELDFHKRVRKGFFEFFKKVPHAVIDANQETEGVKSDFAEIMGKILKN